MHNCPPCLEFTPVFAELYKEQEEKLFEVVFCSGDPTTEEFTKYFADMPWLSMPWKDARIKDLASQFCVKGVPRLICLSTKGEIVNDNCLKMIDQYGPQAIEDLLAKC